jgi:serine protease
MTSQLAIRTVAAPAVVLALALVGSAQAARGADFVPGRVIVGLRPATTLAVRDVSRLMGVRATPGASPRERILKLKRGASVWKAIARLRREPGVAYAVPDYIAHIAGGEWFPNDPGKAGTPGGWTKLQWNLLPTEGIDAPGAWANLLAVQRPGGKGVVVAILDTGIAYRNWHQYRRSPDFQGTRFVDPRDLVAGNNMPVDREGHGTFVAGEIAESTNNRIGLTGIAYGASIMPVRILDSDGNGDASTIARGIRYAVRHGANIINLSLEFSLDVTSSEIPDIIAALRYAHQHDVVVVASAGNDAGTQVAYPARAAPVISVGATTIDRCLAAYSNTGARLDLVAPGGGDDSSLLSDPSCQPTRNLPNVYQMTFFSPSHPGRFGLPGGWYGTSMSAPEVTGAAALVIGSGVLGPHPTPDQVLYRLQHTAQPLGGSQPNPDYGWGLIDAGAATNPAIPVTPPVMQPVTPPTPPSTTTQTPPPSG